MRRIFTYLIRKLQHIFICISEILRAIKNDDKNDAHYSVGDNYIRV